MGQTIIIYRKCEHGYQIPPVLEKYPRNKSLRYSQCGAIRQQRAGGNEEDYGPGGWGDEEERFIL